MPPNIVISLDTLKSIISHFFPHHHHAVYRMEISAMVESFGAAAS
ncbi:MAG: hypothetical protein K0Q56_357 [Sporolactobacillus laevolacticus]|jgi:hypothetical protein|nr:hypothetical protein [Sporolactobacillus laevolacticus]